MSQRTKSMELKAIRDRVQESPPPAPAGTSIRQWFAGLALMNPTLMSDVPDGRRGAEAVRLADELIAALATPKVPTLDSMRAPTPAELADWERQLEIEKEAKEKQHRAERPTCPDLPRVTPSARRPTMRFQHVLPAPLSIPPTSFDAAPPTPLQIHTRRSNPPMSDTRYSYKGENIVEDVMAPTVRPGRTVRHPA